MSDENSELYALRFTPADQSRRDAAWRVLCDDFFARYVPEDGTVVDVGAGDGLFIRHVRAKRRIAVDISTRARALANEGIEVCIASADAFADNIAGEANVVFISNLLEHLPSRVAVVATLRECHRALRADGLAIVLQPNIRYTGGAYWDFLDHQIPLTDKSVAEALGLAGFEIVERHARFLPYTATSFRAWPPGWIAAGMRLYLRIPLLWRVFGSQSLLVARPARH